MLTSLELRVADECWVALAKLHQQHPDRNGFTAREIIDQVGRNASGRVRPGVQPHVYQHLVANVAPNSARYRMFYRLDEGTYRLFKPGDGHHPDRGGKTQPSRDELPAEYHGLLDWYEQVYSKGTGADMFESDPVLAMLGAGEEIWKDECGDAFIARERREWDEEEAPVASAVPPGPSARDSELVWTRLRRLEGQRFETSKGLPFTFQIDGNGIWFYREGKRINKRLGRHDFEKALVRCPLDGVREISDCFDSSYLYGILMDRRVRRKDW